MEQYLNNIKLIAEYYGLNNQLYKTAEELEELKIAVENYFKENNKNNRENLISELADVIIMTSQIAYLLDISDEVKAMINYKLVRQLKRIEKINRIKNEKYN